jgi:methionyl-tRNA formyltransferase
VPIHDDDDLSTLVGRMMGPMPALLLRALERVARGDEGDPQDEAQASYAGLFEPEWRFIDWTRPARTVHNQVRSWSGVRDIPAGALASINGEEVVITRTRLMTGVDQVEPTSTAGDVVQRHADHLVVQCGDGPIEVIAWAGANG